MDFKTKSQNPIGVILTPPWITEINQCASMLDIVVDVPKESWLEEKRAYAIGKGRNAFGVPHMGAMTAFSRIDSPVYVPTEVLKVLPGMRGEQCRVRQRDLDSIVEIMDRTGKLPLLDDGSEYCPFINVAHNGEAWVNEGNHRIMSAAVLSSKFPHLPVQIAYYDGGERESGPLSIKAIFEYQVEQATSKQKYV